MNEIGESIWKAEGQASGPSVMIIGGTHGNERTGVDVIKRLVDELEIMVGSIVLALGNLKAIEINKRGSEPHQDLNRSYPPDLLQRDLSGTYEDKRARELAPHIIEAEIVIDIHATNKPSEPFVACLHSDEHKEVYQWFPCEKVLADPNYVMGTTPVTTDEYAEAHGAIGICYETGQSTDVSRVDEVYDELLRFLASQKMIDAEPPKPVECVQEIYEIVEAITLTSSGFEFAKGLGERSWESFSSTQVIGHHGKEPLVATYDGVIVFPKLSEHHKEGKAVGYLARRVK